MRAAAILGLGCSPQDLQPFQLDSAIEWRMGVPASKDEADVILLFGGDGTIHRHLNALVKLNRPVLVVPCGSGNDFARALGLRHVRDSLAAWRKFARREIAPRVIDLGVITPLARAGDAAPKTQNDWPSTPRYFSCVAGLGLDAEIARRANHLPRWLRAHGGYVLSLPPALFRFAPLPMKILTPAEASPPHSNDQDTNWIARSDQPTMLAAFANTPTYGGGMKIAPRARLDDGLLDVCIVGGVNPFKLFCLSPTVYFGRHLAIRQVNYFQAPRLRVETEHPLDIYADGEYVCPTPVEIGIVRSALPVIAHPAARC